MPVSSDVFESEYYSYSSMVFLTIHIMILFCLQKRFLDQEHDHEKNPNVFLYDGRVT